jgi:hypothetical protein
MIFRHPRGKRLAVSTLPMLLSFLLFACMSPDKSPTGTVTPPPPPPVNPPPPASAAPVRYAYGLARGAERELERQRGR